MIRLSIAAIGIPLSVLLMAPAIAKPAQPTVQSTIQRKNKAASMEAKQLIGATVRGQQAYYLENSVFASNFKDLTFISLPKSKDYQYRIVSSSQPDRFVMMTAIPTRAGLPSYIGLAHVAKPKNQEEFTSFGNVCVSTQNKAIRPNWSDIPKPKPDAPLSCPKGFKELR
jgi:Type IV pilin-like G and H, putative